MRTALRTSSLRSLDALSRHPDVMLAAAVAGIIGMLILPLPSGLLDGLLATNLAFAAVILVAVLLSTRPLSISTFPSLLLITTLFRLSLNVSTTRMILARGSAGEVVDAFGHFVIRGDVVVGLVVFLVITLVQFLVIGKGAERVAEVGARFTLDAMPGKQMSIDAAVRSGAIDESEAQTKRDELARESQFYGAMDGAMKFVKGDAIAGLVITGLNLVAGLVIGVLRNGLSFADAAETYTLLTVGDGLVSQIPALLITLSAGVLTTRVASADGGADLGGSLQEELLSSPKVLGIGAAFAFALGLVPGLPPLPFIVIASGLAGAAHLRRRRIEATRVAASEQFDEKLKAKEAQAKKQRSLADAMPAGVTPLAVEFDPILSRALELGFGDECALVGELMPQVRDTLFVETGVRAPAVVFRQDSTALRPRSFLVRIHDVPVFQGSFDPEKVLVCEPPERLRHLGVDIESYPHPMTRAECSLLPRSAEAAMSAAGYAVQAVDTVVALHLLHLLRKHTAKFLGLHEVSEEVGRLDQLYPGLVKEVVPKVLSMSQLADVLCRLVDERVCIRDLKSILECLAQSAGLDLDRVQLTEHVRAALAMQIAHQHAGLDDKLNVVVLDSLIEDTIQSAIQHVPGGSYLALEPELQEGILAAIARTMRPLVQAGHPPIVLTTASIRRYLHVLLATHFPTIAVVSFQEMPSSLSIQPLGQVTMPEELPASA